MSWIKSVQEKILQKIMSREDPRRQLTEALLWRGFLIELRDSRIWLTRSRFFAPDIACDMETLGQFSVLEVTPSAEDFGMHVAQKEKIERTDVARMHSDEVLQANLIRFAEVRWPNEGISDQVGFPRKNGH